VNIPEVHAAATDVPVRVMVDAHKFPQSVAGIVWRYRPDETPDGKLGLFSSEIEELPLGAPSRVKDCFFRVAGTVLQLGDDPPTPYAVQVEVKQGDTVLHQEVPPKGGSGTIGTQDRPFDYRFVVRVP
jgi:hypothetical protein